MKDPYHTDRNNSCCEIQTFTPIQKEKTTTKKDVFLELLKFVKKSVVFDEFMPGFLIPGWK